MSLHVLKNKIKIVTDLYTQLAIKPQLTTTSGETRLHVTNDIHCWFPIHVSNIYGNTQGCGCDMHGKYDPEKVYPRPRASKSITFHAIESHFIKDQSKKSIITLYKCMGDTGKKCIKSIYDFTMILLVIPGINK